MKFRTLWFAAICGALNLFFIAGGANAVTVEPGNPLTLSFSNLPFVQETPCCGGSVQGFGGASIRLTGDLLGAADSIRLETFENTLADVPFFTNDYTYPFIPESPHFGVTYILPPPWQDVQGVIRLTALFGSINVDHIIITVLENVSHPGAGGCECSQNLYVQTFDFATPLPAALPLFATGLGVLGLIGWRRKRRIRPT